jgi:ubiquinone/menaquinone biosynthesis C-methylase UbiE
VRLNDVELRAMNGPSRRASLRFFELPAQRGLLRRAGVDLTGKRLLDVGCGSGQETLLLWETFRPARLVAFDLMPEQIDRARALPLPADTFRVGDVLAIDAPDASFDGAFDLGILHHVPEWRDGLREVARVLAPGGAFVCEELHGAYVRLQDRLIGTSHPREARFDWPTFRAGLRDAGLDVVAERRLAWEAARAFVAVKRA